jgi:hypothetical protein
MPWRRNRISPYDDGNGALAYVMTNTAYPGIERVRVVPYARDRGGPFTYYRLEGTGAGAFVLDGCRAYSTLAKARAARQKEDDDARDHAVSQGWVKA